MGRLSSTVEIAHHRGRYEDRRTPKSAAVTVVVLATIHTIVTQTAAVAYHPKTETLDTIIEIQTATLFQRNSATITAPVSIATAAILSKNLNLHPMNLRVVNQNEKKEEEIKREEVGSFVFY